MYFHRDGLVFVICIIINFNVCARQYNKGRNKQTYAKLSYSHVGYISMDIKDRNEKGYCATHNRRACFAD